MNNTFQANARIILEIGRESIENKIIALSEIVKNSYDANAKNCYISLNEGSNNINLFEKEIEEITIIDDGDGMNSDDLINNWLVLGTNSKLNKKLNKSKDNKIGRIPIGEKGIGRFAVNKLGDVIHLITKKRDSKCFSLKVDFRDFEENRMLDEIKIEIQEIDDIEFNGSKHGTKIVISNLREKWDNNSIILAYDELLKLQSPFYKKEDYFEVHFIVPNQDILKNRLKPNQILDYSIWQSEVFIDENIDEPIMKFRFTPYKEMHGLENFESEFPIKLFSTEKKAVRKIELNKYRIGPVRIRLFAFHRSTAVLKMLKDNREVVKKYLDVNGGVRVYRDNQRIYNYGSPNEDWLGLNLKRLNSPGSKLSKNILIGVVELDGLRSRDLIEKTNREGFIDNLAFYNFRELISLIVDEFAFNLINTKDKIKMLYDRNVKYDKLDDTFFELENEINSLNSLENADKNKIITMIQNISNQYTESKQLLLSIANTSVDFHMVFHDIEKQVKLLIKLINNKAKLDEIKGIAFSIRDVLNLQHDLITNRSFELMNINDILSVFKQYAKYRLLDHNVNITYEVDDIKLNCVGSQILRIFINLLDNSIYWLETRKEDRKVFIKVYRRDDKICIIFADNGPGIPQKFEDDIFKPFVTKKKDGLGLGLYIVNEIVELHNGSIKLVNSDEIGISEEYKFGAKFLLELMGTINDVK